MEKFHEASGKTIDEAIQNALNELGMDRDSVSVEVLEKPKSGFLGLGGTAARVRVSYTAEETPMARNVEIPKPVRQAETPRAVPSSLSQTQSAVPMTPAAAPRKPTASQGSRDVRTTAFLDGLLERMDAKAAIELNITEEGHLEYTLEGSKAGLLIGRRGETLDALQHLAGSVANRGEESPVRVTLDVGGYRAKREASLVDMAKNNAARAVRFRRNVTLEPMNSYARHVIHTALQDYPGVSTHSVGTDPNRRVVIAVSGGDRPYGGSGNHNRR